MCSCIIQLFAFFHSLSVLNYFLNSSLGHFKFFLTWCRGFIRAVIPGFFPVHLLSDCISPDSILYWLLLMIAHIPWLYHVVWFTSSYKWIYVTWPILNLTLTRDSLRNSLFYLWHFLYLEISANKQAREYIRWDFLNFSFSLSFSSIYSSIHRSIVFVFSL